MNYYIVAVTTVLQCDDCPTRVNAETWESIGWEQGQGGEGESGKASQRRWQLSWALKKKQKLAKQRDGWHFVQRITYAKVQSKRKPRETTLKWTSLAAHPYPFTFHHLLIFAFIYLMLVPLYVTISSFLAGRYCCPESAPRNAEGWWTLGVSSSEAKHWLFLLRYWWLKAIP